MAEIVYPPVVAAAKTAFRLYGLRIDIQGAEHVPRTGGAVLAMNHVGYLDFVFGGLGTQEAGRLVRFMAKESIFGHPVAGPLMRGMHHISVDRSAGAQSYRLAVETISQGEVVGVFPEATISRSFELKEFKTGAARMARDAGVPLLPMVLWGTQRLLTKGRSPRGMKRRGVAISIAIGEPLPVGPDSDPAATTAELKRRMADLLEAAQRDYPDRPASSKDSWWLPARLGGTAPTLQEAGAIEAALKAKAGSGASAGTDGAGAPA